MSFHGFLQEVVEIIIGHNLRVSSFLVQVPPYDMSIDEILTDIYFLVWNLVSQNPCLRCQKVKLSGIITAVFLQEVVPRFILLYPAAVLVKIPVKRLRVSGCQD